jgi:hypothetical protein
MVRIPTNEAPAHPGEILLEDYLKPLGMTQVELAGRLEAPLNRVNEIVKGKRKRPRRPSSASAGSSRKSGRPREIAGRCELGEVGVIGIQRT